MLTDREKVEYTLLNLLTESEIPMGSVTLSLLLKERNLDVSGATVGRMLSEFDYKGLTSKRGFKGRILTETGQKLLSELEDRQQIAEYSTKLYESIDAKSKDNLLNVLIARRGIERETARLAATRATAEDMAELHGICRSQHESLESSVSAEKDVQFHQCVARASKNMVLATAYDFIWQNKKLSPVMEFIRLNVGGRVVVDHDRIVQALVARDPDDAEVSMMQHIDSLIDDVNKYWHRVHKGM